MRRLNVFAKGNVDVRDSLLFSSVAGAVQWNGINEIVRRDFPGHSVRVRHETMTRSDALATADGTVPAELRELEPFLGPYSLESQFSRRLFDTPSDIVILSIQPDVTTPMVRHRRTGYLFLPYEAETWPEAQRRWLAENFESAGYMDPAQSMQHLAQICRKIQAGVGAPILIYNLSAVVPGEHIHCYAGLDEALSTRIRRFNLALVELSQRLSVSIVDVDAVLARAGADRLKVGPVHLTAEGYRLVAQEVVHILRDLGCFDR